MSTRKPKHPKSTAGAGKKHVPVEPPPPGNDQPIPTGGPQFGEPVASADPTAFKVKHGSDDAAYKIIDTTKQNPRPFPVLDGTDEPTMTLATALGPNGQKAVNAIQKAGQLVFHSVGDTGNTAGPHDEDLVADKMVSDFTEHTPADVPSFFFHLGDVVYSFGESQYYYDQFYDVYRDYPAPIFAIAGNHDGMVAPNTSTPTLQSFLSNFCTAGQAPHRTPEAGGLARTAGLQPGVYYTLEAPFVRILALYSNCLEDPGVISSEGGTYPYMSDAQLTFLTAALKRVKTEKYTGAVVIAMHHPPYTAVLPNSGQFGGKHDSSTEALKEIDACCAAAGVWPHAFLSGHAHNYQRFTRTQGKRQTPFIVAGNGGHGLSKLGSKRGPAIRVPLAQPDLSNGSDTVVFENYDDQDYGYLRVVVNAKQLRIEYHPASDGAATKSPDDSVTVDLASYQLVSPTIPA